jgi:hypothetical protein
VTVADIVVDGFTRVAYVPTIASQAAPTTTELNAGILLQSVMTPDGLTGFEPSTADVDNSALNSTFDTKTIGRDSFSGTKLIFKKQSGTDTVYNTLTRGTAGYIVVRRYIDNATAWASSQVVEVYPVIFGQTRNLAPTANTVTKWEVDTKITSSPSIRAAVA